MTRVWLSRLLHVLLNACASASLVNTTFVNELDFDCSLFWHGADSGPRKDFGPLLAGGQKVLEAYEGHIFTLARAGTLTPLLRVQIDSTARRHVLNTQTGASSASNASAAELTSCAATAAAASLLQCRNAADSCAGCVRMPSCGWSMVRRQRHSARSCSVKLSRFQHVLLCAWCCRQGISLSCVLRCVPAHPIAARRTCDESKAEDIEGRSAEQWLQLAESLMDPESASFGLASLQAAYEALEHGKQAATVAAATAVATSETLSSILRWQAEVRPKLEGVLDDMDAEELIAASRHASLLSLSVRPRVVSRRKTADALDFLSRAEPVVITDLFDTNSSHPVPQKWTLEYLKRFMHKGFYNVAADNRSACCQYYEPRRVAAEAGYPYPFRPRTHLYKDHFAGFVETLRASRASQASQASGEPSGESSRSSLLHHYLHDVLMERDGTPVVAGEAATPQVAADLSATVTALRPLSRMQPFFAGIANAKLWVGQKGVTMPLHYDSSDNLYVMAWGRKRAILAEPGQYGALYPYPNAHPLAGSSQVNLQDPDLARHPGFADAVLWETVVGPGDVLYLPGYWWHQFEQPFEDHREHRRASCEELCAWSPFCIV